MAFLDSGNPQVVAHVTVERRHHVLLGAQTRNVTEYRLSWAIDATGGEAPPATYGGIDLMHHGPEIEYGGVAGIYVAFYRDVGAWS